MERTAYTYFYKDSYLLFEAGNQSFKQARATITVDGGDRGNLTSDRTSETCA